MRGGQRWALLFLTLLLWCPSWSVQGAPIESQLHLGRGPAEQAAPFSRAAARYSTAYGPTQQQQEQPGTQQHWWQRWAAWWPWGGGTSANDPQRMVRVRPAHSDGSWAAPVDLVLPESHIERELRPAPAAADSAGGSGGMGPPGSLYDYNSSAMMPLIPWSWSWMSDADQIRNRSNGFDIDLSRTLSLFAAISYCNISNLQPWNCTRCVGPAAGFTTQTVVYDELWNLMAFAGYSQPLGAIVVSFRGTDSHSLYNWVENMRTWRTDMHIDYPDAPAGALVHGGFFYSYNSSVLATNITRGVKELAAAHPGAPVYVVGHSLGGAMATICALDIRLNLGVEDVRLFTFGSPRVGNFVFAQWFRQYVKVRWRFTHNRDIVPSVPIQLMGFRHVAQEVWLLELDKSHTLVGLCDESGEDARCHNSMCYMGLCTSVGDHLLYMSEMYNPRPFGC